MKLRSTYAWLFAFTDLAFLLLISLSMIPSAPAGVLLHFAEMDPPQVPDNERLEPIEERPDAWELQVLAATERPSPFRLVRVDARSGKELEAAYLDRQELLPAIDALRADNIRPVLLPEKSSFSHDFLFAAGTLARVWSDGRSPTVVRPEMTGDSR